MLDTPRVVTTPEGIELTLNIAGPVARARAWLIDMLIRGVIYILLGTALSAFGRFGIGIFLFFMFLLEWAYPVLFEVLWQGATPGKRACQLRVLHDDGTPIGWRASVARNTLRAVDFLPLFYGFGLISCLLNRDFKRLGDLAAGTVVVYVARDARRRSSTSSTSSVDSVVVSDGQVLTQIARLKLDEQRAIINFAERRPRWSDARAAELAEHSAVVLNGKTGKDAIDRLIALARQITGRSVSPPNAPSNLNTKGTR
jgi:uncharacterized RDD family membrane protein YckC